MVFTEISALTEKSDVTVHKCMGSFSLDFTLLGSILLQIKKKKKHKTKQIICPTSKIGGTFSLKAYKHPK